MFRRVTSLDLVGRQEELFAIRAAASAAANGDGRIVLIAGDAGIGKLGVSNRIDAAAIAQRMGHDSG